MSVPRKLAAPEEHDALHLPHRIMTPEYLRWYDYWLKGIDTGVMDEPPLNLVTGNLRASHRGLEKKELKPWEFNNDHTRKVPVVPGEINEYTIEVMNTSNVFRKGHRIDVEVKNYDANPYHWMVQLPNSQDIEYKIFVDSIHNSYINLPIIPYSDEDQWIR